MGKKHKNKVRVLPGRMYRLVRSDRSVYCDAENALRTCFIEETKAADRTGRGRTVPVREDGTGWWR